MTRRRWRLNASVCVRVQSRLPRPAPLQRGYVACLLLCRAAGAAAARHRRCWPAGAVATPPRIWQHRRVLVQLGVPAGGLSSRDHRKIQLPGLLGRRPAQLVDAISSGRRFAIRQSIRPIVPSSHGVRTPTARQESPAARGPELILQLGGVPALSVGCPPPTAPHRPRIPGRCTSTQHDIETKCHSAAAGCEVRHYVLSTLCSMYVAGEDLTTKGVWPSG